MARGISFLTADEERALAVRWRNGDERAMQRLVECHLPLARKYASHFAAGRSLEDLVSEACIGLLEAAKRFDPDRGFRFSTFARHWVLAAVTDYVIRSDNVVRGPVDAKGRRAFWRGQTPKSVSLSTPVYEGDDLTLGDTIADPCDTPDQTAEQIIDAERNSAALKRCIAGLPKRTATIIRRRHLSEDGCTLDDLGAELSISKERVRQIEGKAFEKIRAVMRKAVPA